MYEKKFKAIAPQALTANGTILGSLRIADECLLKVKEKIRLSANTLPDLDLEIKRVEEDGLVYVGEVGKPIDHRTDISAYTMALSASLSWPEDQKRPNITADEFERACYEEEPTVAKRVVMVDCLGKKYGPNNPLPIAFDGTIAVGNVTIQDDDGDELEINPDGSINVNIVQSSNIPGLTILHNEISSVAAGVETTVISLVSAAPNYRINKIETSGDNVAHFRVKINGSTIVNKRSYWTDFNQTFDFEGFENGLVLGVGDILTVTVIHNRPDLGSFEATIMAK